LSESHHICELASKPPNRWAFRDVTKESSDPPAAPGSALASANYSDDEIRVYYLAVWNHICELTIKADCSWSSLDVSKESNAPPAAPGSTLTSDKYSSVGILVYYLTGDQCIVELATTANGWRSLDVTKESGSPPAAPGRTLKLMNYKKDKKGPKPPS
jgi:hypothetical protein